MFTQAIFWHIQLFGHLLKGLSISTRTESSVHLLSSDVRSFFGERGQILGGGELQQPLRPSGLKPNAFLAMQPPAQLSAEQLGMGKRGCWWQTPTLGTAPCPRAVSIPLWSPPGSVGARAQHGVLTCPALLRGLVGRLLTPRDGRGAQGTVGAPRPWKKGKPFGYSRPAVACPKPPPPGHEA